MSSYSLDVEDEGLNSLTGQKQQAGSKFSKALQHTLPSCCFTRKFKIACGCSVFLVISLIIIIVSVTAATVSKARSNGTDSVRWILVGKTGYAVTDGYTSQALVASALANYVNSSGLIPTPSFVINTGDNFPMGLGNLMDPAFQQFFGGVYNQPQLNNMAWNTVLGDADYDGNVSAIVKANILDPRFTVRRTGSTMKLIFPGSESWAVQPPALAAIVFVDTPPWVKSTRVARPFYPTADYSDLSPPVPSPQQSVNASAANVSAAWAKWEDAQIAALDRALSDQWVQAAFWRVVVGHDCIVSAGPAGPIADIGRITQLLQQRRVGLYACGHDADMQIYGEDNFGMIHLVSGAGAIGDNISPNVAPNAVGAPKLEVYGNPGFLSIRMHAEAIDVDIIGGDGATKASRKIYNPLYTP